MDMDATEEDAAHEKVPGTVRSRTDLPRYEGPLAVLANKEAKLEDATLAGDVGKERALSVELARLYAERGLHLGDALRLAERAATLGEEGGLSIELAGWRAGLGDPAGAAGHLELAGGARNLVRAGVLYGRARRATDAYRAFEAAAREAPTDPIPHELIGTLCSWAGDVVSHELASEAYSRAAELRADLGEPDAALEDLLRAFEVCPASPEAAADVAASLAADGRPRAAQELLRDHAAALEDAGHSDQARAARLHRLTSALAADDLAGALSASLDLGLFQGARHPEVELRTDEVLARVGLPELLALRLVMRARGRTGPQAAASWEAAARVYANDLSSDKDATAALVEAAVANPTSTSALDALRQRESRDDDQEGLVEALVRIVGVVKPPEATLASRAALALELAELAGTRLGDPALSDWALERARALDSTQAELVAHSRGKLEAELSERDDEIARTEALLEARGSVQREARLLHLKKLVSLYGRAPAFETRTFETLAAICRADPRDTLALRSIALLFRREDPSTTSWSELYDSILRARLEGECSRRDALFVRTELVLLSLRGDAPGAALGIAGPMLDDVSQNPRLDESYAVGAAGLALAVRGGEGASREEARSLSVLGEVLGEGLGAIFLAAASERWREVGALVEARSSAERALEMDSRCGQAATALARVSAVLGGRDAALAIERALGVVVPRAWLCDSLARILEAIGEQELAFAWTQRWLALAPSDRRAVAELLRRCLAGTDGGRITSALLWVLAQPDPPDDRAVVFADALAVLYTLDKKAAEQVARRALDVFGPKAEAFRERLLTMADEHGDRGLAIALLERHVASSPAALWGDVLLELSHRRVEVGDWDGACRELAKAAERADPELVVAVTDELLASERAVLLSDGLVALWAARARASLVLLRSRSEAGAETEAAVADDATRTELLRTTIEAFRTVGALRWDLAEDPRGAEQALYEAAELDLRDGFEIYAEDLRELAGVEPALSAMHERWTLSTEEPTEKLVALGLAMAHLASEHGLAERALDAARRVLGVDATNAEAISIAESQASHVAHGDVVIDEIYSALARQAMGIYGRRAAHYRAARKLERLGSNSLAERHAILAFEAVPNEGSSWQILTRLVDPIAGSEQAVEAFLQVASVAPKHEVAVWYKRALELCGKDADGLSRALDVLLRALVGVPETYFATQLHDVLKQLADFGPYPDLTAERFERAVPSILKRLEGPDGARAAVQLAKALLLLDAKRAAFACLEAAADNDGGVEAFERLLGDVWQLAEDPELSAEFVRSVERRVVAPHSVVGPPLLGLAAAFASELGDKHSELALSKRAEELTRAEAAPAESPGEDPFADPSFLDSSPAPEAPSIPPATTPDGGEAPSAPVSPDEAPPTVVAPQGEPLRVTAPPATTPAEPPNPELSAAEPRTAAPSGRARRASSVAEFHAVQDGFDALFADLADRLVESGRSPSERPSMHPTAAPPPLQAPRLPDHPLATTAVSATESRRDTSPPKAAHAGPSGAPPAAPDPLTVLLEQVADTELAPELRCASAIEASQILERAGDLKRALRAIDGVPRTLSTGALADRRIALLRALGDGFGLIVAIDQRTSLGDLGDDAEAQLLIEASRLAAASGDEQGALVRARRAQRLTPTNPAVVLESLLLEYRARGMGTPRDATQCLDTLHGIEGQVDDAHVEVFAFLLAEATDVIHGGGAGLRELAQRHAAVGPLPLIALGMAERLLRARSFEAAVPLFEYALAGDLRDLRARPRVALAAADAAIQAAPIPAAERFLAICDEAPELRSQIERRRREIQAHDPDPTVAAPVLRALAQESSGLVRARFLQRLGKVLARSNFEEGIKQLEDALVIARRDRSVAEEIRADMLALIEEKSARAAEARGDARADAGPERRNASEAAPSEAAPSEAAPSEAAPSEAAPSEPPRRRPVSEAPSSIPDRPATLPDPQPLPDLTSAPVLDEPPSSASVPSTERVDSAPSATVPSTEPSPSGEASPLPRRRLPVPPPHAWPARPGLESVKERDLYEELCEGHPEAADDLLAFLGEDRRRDRVLVQRFAALLEIGDGGRLTALRDEVLADGDDAFAQALDHVLAVREGRSTPAPPLASQAREPDLVQALLLRGAASRETEALRLVWDAGLFRRDAGELGLTPKNRVAPSSSVLADLYREIAQSLGSARALHHLPDASSHGIDVALVAQPAVVVRGPAMRTREVSFQLAYCHATALPDLILAAHLSETALRSIFAVLLAAFGPVSDDAPPSSEVFRDEARLSADLWQRISPASERRLRELLNTGPLSVEGARSAARLVGWRAGLFVTGDLWHTLSVVARTESLTWPLERTSREEGLADLCRASPAVRDLVSLAARGEYAAARWAAPITRASRF
jgi:tetratricopeptide (TPR) repeat protein